MTLWRRAGGLRFAGIALLVAVALRLLQLLVVTVMTDPQERAVDRLLIWDGGWFLNVASEGYPDGYTYDDDGVRLGNGFAFFPLFPLLVRGVAALGVPTADASLLVAGVAGLFAALLVYLLGVALWSRPVGMILMVLVCAQPMGVVLSMGYTESLFLALVAGALLAAYQRIWWLAGLAGIAAGLTRPTGLALGLALALAAFLLRRQSLAQATPAKLAAPTIPFRPTALAAQLSRPQAVAVGLPAALDDHDDDDDDDAAELEDAQVTRPPLPGLARGALTRGTGQWSVLGAPGISPGQGATTQVQGSGGSSGPGQDPGGQGPGVFVTPTGEWRALGLPGERPVGGLLGLAAERTGSGAASKVIGTRKAHFAAKGPVTKRELTQAWVAAALTVLTGPVFVLWVGWQVGEWDAWFKVQTAGWGSTLDGGVSVWNFLVETLAGGSGMVEAVTVWLILGTVVLSGVAIAEKVWPPLVVYGLIVLALVLGQAGYWHSKPRLLVPVLLLACVPVARALAVAPRKTAVALLALWSVFGLWFGAHMISIWPFTI